MVYSGSKWSMVVVRTHVMYINVFVSYLFVFVCGGYAGETLYPREITVSTGAF